MSGVLKQRTAVHNPDRQDASGGPRLASVKVKNSTIKMPKLYLLTIYHFQALFKCHVIVIGVLIASGLFELLPYLLCAYLCLL